MGQGHLLSRLSPQSRSLCHPGLLLLLGLTPLTPPFSAAPSTCSLLLCLPHPNALAPEQPAGALWACPHSAPLGLPCCPQGPPTASVSLPVPAQVLWAGCECVCINCWCAWLGASWELAVWFAFPGAPTGRFWQCLHLHVRGLWATCLGLQCLLLESCGVQGQAAAQGSALLG